MKFQPFVFVCLAGISVAFVGAQELDPPVRPDKANNQIVLQGVLNPIESLRLATRDPGIVEQVLVNEGDQVKAGDTIVVLDNKMFAAEMSAAQRELQIAQEESKNDVDYEFAKISLAVNEKVYQRSKRAQSQFAKSISKTELERLRLESERSRLSKVQAERDFKVNKFNEALRNDRLEIAKIRFENRTIKSKIDGTVVEVLYRPGEYVNSGQPIARILNLNRLRVVCSSRRGMDPNSVPKEGTFKVEVDGEMVSYPAKVTFVSPEVDPVRQTFPIWAEIQNTDSRLKSGFVGKLEFEKR